MGKILANLRNYQRRGVNVILKRFNGKALLADDMGLGKTLQTLCIISRLPEERVLIVCPAPLKWNWVDEFKKFLPSEKPFVCGGRTPPIFGDNHSRVFLCNYEILQYWADYFVKAGVRVLILDESHRVKNRATKAFHAALKISKVCRYRVLLTGTPIENRPAELWSQLQILDAKLFPSWLLFVKRYNGARRNQWGWELKGATNVKELHEILVDTCMVRRKKVDVLTELPPKVRVVYSVDISNRAEYDEAYHNILAWIRKNTTLDISRTRKAEAIVKLDKLKYISGVGKLDGMVEWINEESENQKLVVFCYHKDVLHNLSLRLKKHVLVSSELQGEERQELVHRFQNDPKIRIFLTTLRVGGTGLTLTAASTTVFCQQDWNAAKHDQAEDRVNRIGQEADSVTAVYFVARNTVEEKIVRLIDAKRQDATGVIDGHEVEDSELITKLMEELT